MKLQNVFSKKEINSKVSPLPAEIIEKIPVVNHAPELIEIDRKIATFKELLKAKNLELTQTSCSAPFGQVTVKPDALKDGQALVEGTEIEALAGPMAEDRRKNVTRQVNALLKAIAICENDKRHKYKTAITEACENLPQEVTDVFRNVIEAAEGLENAIRKAMELDEILNRKGLEAMRRPPQYVLIQFWRDLILTGFASGYASLSVVLEGQKSLWERSENGK